MQTYPVQAGSLSSLLDTRSGIELIAEPYRLQKGVVLGVAYSEYVNYVHLLSEDSGIRLFSDTRNTVRKCNAKDPLLYNSYLQDMAFALCKELFYAERSHEDATVILPITDKGSSIAASRFLQMVMVPPNIEYAFENLLRTCEYSEKIRSARNARLKRIALGMYTLSSKGEVVGELCLSYDLD